MSAGSILVVDDDTGVRDGLARLLQKWGYQVHTASSAEEALDAASAERPWIVITDLVLPEMDGIALLQKLKELARPPVILILTAYGTVTTAVEAMRQGAFYYLTKPVDPVQLQVLLEKALDHASLANELDVLRHQLRQKGSFGKLTGTSKGLQAAFRWIELAARSTVPVFVWGESGTGKELVARTIHETSSRRRGPFVAVNCAALPESLIESEIFGHERGAFTGATDRRPGCFELADGGTLLLDEIAEMNTQLQAKLLRILQDSTFRRVGGKEEIRVDVRVIAATNRTPEEALASGKLRQDLFFRLNVFAISLPPLRERPEDIVPLARVFCEEFNRDHGREVVGFTPEAQATLLRYHWPGNVRELRNALQRAVALAGGPLISEEELMPALLLDQRSSVATSAPATGRIRDMERQLIAATLERVHHDKTRAAVELGISLKTLYNKIAKYKIGSGQPAKRDR